MPSQVLGSETEIAPCAGRLTSFLDEPFEPIQVALDAPIEDAEDVAGLLRRALRLVLKRVSSSNWGHWS